METPLFTQWRRRFAPLRSRLRKVRQATFTELELCFANLLPPHLLSQADEGLNSRERVFPTRRTFWLFLSQVLTPNTSCRAVVRQLQSLRELGNLPPINSANAGYVQARARLPFQTLRDALRLSATAAQARSLSNSRGSLAGRPVKVVDATSTQLPDTEANQRRYPQPSRQKPGCGFPVMKVMALFSLASGAVLHVACANLHWNDFRLFRCLWRCLRRGDIVLGDRAFSDYASLAELPRRGVDLLARLHQARKVDFRRAVSRLGKSDALFRWCKGTTKPHYMSLRQWGRVADEITVRVLRFQIDEPGFRTRKVWLVTTLTDGAKYPAADLMAAYRRRWRLELCFRDLKTTMGMEKLSCQSPAMVKKELHMFLIAHNLIRCLMAEASGIYGVELERVSFKGSVDATREFSKGMARARTRKKRRELEGELLRVLATDPVRERPGRHEPRAVKRRGKTHPLLTCHRRAYRDIPHRNRYRKSKPSKSKGTN